MISLCYGTVILGITMHMHPVNEQIFRVRVNHAFYNSFKPILLAEKMGFKGVYQVVQDPTDSRWQDEI